MQIVCSTHGGGISVEKINGYELKSGANNYIADRPARLFPLKINYSGIRGDDNKFYLPTILDVEIRDRIYAFKAERMNIGRHPVGSSNVLQSNASNLPEVLGQMQSNHSRFDKYNDLVKRIFPSINRITVRALQNGENCIFVWQHDYLSEREDLATPLSECGTGISQVLAVLYVVLTADYSKVIIIDEPQSFLHPGAARKLFEILREYPQHQYIISSHSATAITTLEPKRILKITMENGVSRLSQIAATESGELKSLLSEIGVRLSDVFGADSILWVEGKTEEICFQRILLKTPGIKYFGTQILGVVHTGDFDGKLSKVTYEVYKRLSEGSAILPPPIGFVFDRERRTPAELQKLEENSNGKVVFLNRCMFENYLLNPKAIMAVINARDRERPSPLTEQEVNSWLALNKWNATYFERPVEADKQTNEVWIMKVHAARLLDAMFNHFTTTRVSFDKTNHSVALADWILDNSPDDLSEIRLLLVGFFKA